LPEPLRLDGDAAAELATAAEHGEASDGILDGDAVELPAFPAGDVDEDASTSIEEADSLQAAE
jgi:hypothetical protein